MQSTGQISGKQRGKNMKELWEIFRTFFKMGAVTFGGGYAMLPMLQREIVEKRGWISNEDVMDYFAVSQGLPGIIAVNVSVFIGRMHRGVPGAIAAALGVVSPCVIIMTFIAACLTNFQDNPMVRNAFAGISVCVAALILDAVIGLWKKGVKDGLGAVLCIAVFCAMEFLDVSPILIVIAAAVIGVAAVKHKGA